MRIGILDVNMKSKKQGQCWVCKQPVETGQLHAVVIMRYGKGQQAAFKLAAAQGRARSTKTGLKYRRLHLADCLAKWLVAIHHYRTEARRDRKGRPKGSGQLQQMSTEDKLIRYRLVRRRAATLRLILTEEDDQHLITLVQRLATISSMMEVDIIEDMAHRNNKNIRTLNEKIRRIQNVSNR